MYAELVINIDAPLAGTFHYHVPADLRPLLRLGHLVEVEFGRRLAQGIVVAFDQQAPVAETKPVIALIDETPVVWPWQIRLAQWISQQYLAPLNASLRLMLPPGLTRYADINVDIHPGWDGSGRLTELQQQLVEILRQKGDLRGRQIRQALPKTDWKTAVAQLVKRNILRRASVLDPPRAKPKVIRTAELIASEMRIRGVAAHLGRRNKQADILDYLAQLDDPLPPADDVLEATQARPQHLRALFQAGLVNHNPAHTLILAAADPETAPAEYRALLRRLPATESMIAQRIPTTIVDELQEMKLVERLPQRETISLAIPASDVLAHSMSLRGAGIYYQILTLLIREAHPVSVSDIYAITGAGLNHLRRLVKLDLIRLSAEEVWRDPLADRDFTPAEAPSLTIDQARAWGKVKMVMIMLAEAEDEECDDAHDSSSSSLVPADTDNNGYANLNTFLLHGVTGSGKTEIYMRAIDFALSQGKQAIVLVPEIALTPQTVRRFAARFPGRIAVMHSRLTPGERYDTWRRARLGLFDIVIGPRSALFSPLPNLGVIIVDEEHDASYKQTPPVLPPYYHAREAAIQLGNILRAIVIMGSATPDVVTYHRAQGGRYQLLELPRRVMGHRQRIESQAQRLRLATSYQRAADDPEDALTLPLPPIQVVDLRQELRAGNRSIFSRALEKAITQTLERSEQAIIFLNRRGTATFVICRDCGHLLKCPRCDLPLTYHRPRLALICHHCGRQEPPHQVCPMCGSKRIRYFGLGTEEVEAQLQQRWPQARIIRWDRDTTSGKGSHEQLLADFINLKADILVGTQMIAKGLDLPLVTLVGVISADVSLGLPDYRTGERAFQVLAQVAGRAGRGLLGGRVIIQTYQPQHYAIQAASEHDFTSFYIQEIRFRTQHLLPPFRRQARLLFIDPINERGQREAERLARGLRQHIKYKALAATTIFGPVPPFFNRIDGRYRWQIIIRSPDPVRLLEDFPLPGGWMADIDPVSTL